VKELEVQKRKGYKKTKLGWIPETWKLMSIDEITERVTNRVAVDPSKDYQEIGIRSHGKGIFHKEKVQGKTLGNKRVFWIESGCFTVNIVFAWEQAVAKTTDKEVGMIASHRFPMYKPKKGILELEFLLYFFKTALGKHLLGLASPGGAGRNKTLGQKTFGQTKIPVPSINEQKKIIELILKWDQSIQLTDALTKSKTSILEAHLANLLSPPMDAKDLKYWKKIKLSEIGQMTKGKGITKKELTLTGIPCIRYGEIYSKHHVYLKKFESHISSEIASSSKQLEKGDILMAGSGESIDEIGKSIAYCKDETAYAGGDIIILRPSREVNSIYVSLALNSSYANRQKRKMGQGNSIVHIYASNLKKLEIWLPSINMQNRIANFFKVSDKEIEILRNKLLNLKKQKSGIMNTIILGKYHKL